jgi:hypothetical protein
VSRPRPLLLAGLLAFALFEVVAHARIVADAPRLADYQAAARALRAELKPRDLIVAAPAWADPVLRQVLGDRIDFAMAGRSDTAAYERLWALSVRGARPPEAPPGEPELSREFGTVTLQRWRLGPSSVKSDLVALLPRAHVRQGARDCAWQRLQPPRGGGLGRGVLPPVERFQCAGRGASWVAPVVLEDLSLAPRHCVLQPPGGREPLTVRFDDLELADRLVVYAGLYYEDERMRQGAPVKLAITLDGAPLGTLTHRDGDGWKRLELPLPAGRSRGSLELTVTSSQSARRNLCWAASLRSGPGGAR